MKGFFAHDVPMVHFAQSPIFIPDNDNADLEPLPRTDLEGFGGQDDLIAGKLIHPPIETDNQQEFNLALLAWLIRLLKLKSVYGLCSIDKTAKSC